MKKKSSFPKSLGAFAPLLKQLSDPDLRVLFILFNKSGTLQWFSSGLPAISAYPEPELKKMKIWEILGPENMGSPLQFKQLLLSGKDAKFSFRIKTNPKPKHYYSTEFRYEPRYEPFGVLSTGGFFEVSKNSYLLALRPILYSNDKKIRKDLSRFTVWVNSKSQIVSFNIGFKDLVATENSKVIGKELQSFFIKKDWDKIKKEENKKKRTLLSIKKNTKSPWEKKIDIDFSKAASEKEFFTDKKNRWHREKRGLNFYPKYDIGFFTVKKPVVQFERDVLVKLTFQGPVTLGMGVFINGLGSALHLDEGTPDRQGYLGTFEHSPFGFLKKQNNAQHHFRYPENLENKEHEIIFEKTGGILTFKLDKKTLFSFSDTSPIFNKHLRHVGVLCRYPVQFKSLAVFTRVSQLKQNEFKPEMRSLRLKQRPDRFYKFNTVPINMSHLTASKELLTEYVFNDFTDLKIAQNKLEKSEQKKALHISKLELELDEARKIQKSLLPANIPKFEKGEIAANLIPTGKVGGDLYDIFWFSPKDLGILIIDVAGHGLSAALIASMAKMSFSRNLKQSFSPAEVMINMNEELVDNIKTNHFVAAFFAVLNIETLQLKYCNCGHIPPLKFDAKNAPVTRLQMGGAPLGWLKENNLVNREISLKKGARILFYTDGLNETFNPEKKQFGVEKLYSVTKKNKRKSVREFIEILERERGYFAKKPLPTDDVTTVGLFIH